MIDFIKASLVCGGLLMGLLTTQALAEGTLSYQGQLTDAARQSVTASYPMTFALYPDAREGGAVWTETHPSVDIVEGVFTVDLGSIVPFPNDISASAALYLGVSVNGAPEMTPRMAVSTVLRARWAAHAQDVQNEDIHPRSVSIGDLEVIDAQGFWVGSPVGLQGPSGNDGIGVVSATIDEQGQLLVSLSSGQTVTAGSVRNPNSCGLSPALADGEVIEGMVSLTCTGSEPVLLRTVRCGDGIKDPNEACDDGNDVDTDACTSACKVAVCGDGILRAGVEACDDGNQEDLDACSNSCVIARCGDGIVQEGEACDDMNDENRDGCKNDCQKPVCNGDTVSAGDDCDDGVSCTVDECDPNSGCTNRVDDSLCNDGNVCTTNYCVLTRGCRSFNNNNRCDDGNPNTGADLCDRGVCRGTILIP